MKSKDTIDTFLEGPRETRTRCTTCKSSPEIVQDIDRYLEARREGTTRRTVSELHRYLVSKHGYTAHESTLYNHIHRCRGGIQ